MQEKDTLRHHKALQKKGVIGLNVYLCLILLLLYVSALFIYLFILQPVFEALPHLLPPVCPQLPTRASEGPPDCGKTLAQRGPDSLLWEAATGLDEVPVTQPNLPVPVGAPVVGLSSVSVDSQLGILICMML